MRHNRIALAIAIACPLSIPGLALAQSQSTAQGSPQGPLKQLGAVTATDSRPRSLLAQIPTTMEIITGDHIALSINATDAEDSFKYFPTLLVGKRYQFNKHISAAFGIDNVNYWNFHPYPQHTWSAELKFDL